MAEGIKLIVGLGNPGSEYAASRHNVGAWFITQLAHHHQQVLRPENKFHGLVAQWLIATEVCWLLQPTTFMNESGKSISALMHFYKILPQQILVVHDDLDFPAGVIRLKEGGGHGGHNGLRHIIDRLQTGDFYRLRIGIGHPGHKDRVTPYVLSSPSRDDQKRILHAIDRGISVVPDLVKGTISKAMRELHGGI